jgi:hypothetical protein
VQQVAARALGIVAAFAFVAAAAGCGSSGSAPSGTGGAGGTTSGAAGTFSAGGRVGTAGSSGGGAGGTSDGGLTPTLDCAWLGGNNCWKTTATAATSCLPPATETGVLSADGRTCTYASGAVVTFAAPVVLPLSGNETWDFTIANGGQTCLHYVDDNMSFQLTVAGQTVSEAYTTSLGIGITCPDGTTYTSTNALGLLSCNPDGGGFGGLPGNATSWTDTSLVFGLVSTNDSSDELQLFSCSKP